MLCLTRVYNVCVRAKCSKKYGILISKPIKPVKTGQNRPKPGKTGHNRPNTAKPAKTRQNRAKPAKKSPNRPKPAKTCQKSAKARAKQEYRGKLGKTGLFDSSPARTILDFLE